MTTITENKASAKLLKSMIIGGAVALTGIAVFLSGVDDPDPEWHALWYLRPLIIVPIAGSLGGAFYHLMNNHAYNDTWKTIFAKVVGVTGYIIAFWIGSVMGLDGTLWD